MLGMFPCESVQGHSRPRTSRADLSVGLLFPETGHEFKFRRGWNPMVNRANLQRSGPVTDAQLDEAVAPVRAGVHLLGQRASHP